MTRIQKPNEKENCKLWPVILEQSFRDIFQHTICKLCAHVYVYAYISIYLSICIYIITLSHSARTLKGVFHGRIYPTHTVPYLIYDPEVLE